MLAAIDEADAAGQASLRAALKPFEEVRASASRRRAQGGNGTEQEGHGDEDAEPGAPLPPVPEGPTVPPARAACGRPRSWFPKLLASFLTRGVRVLTELVDALEPGELQRAVTEGSHMATLLRALGEPGAVPLLLTKAGPLAKARVKGVQRRAAMLEADGGTLTTEEVAARLAMSRQGVNKRRQAGKLLALETGRRAFLYPAWQFVEDGVLPGLAETLEALKSEPPLAQLRFFLTDNLRLRGRKPLDDLRKGRVEAVVEAARAFGEHGAA